MRTSALTAFGLTAFLLSLVNPVAAQSPTPWDRCISRDGSPAERVSACTAVIEAKSESGRKLAAVYCNRGYGLTEQREYERALADLDEAVRITPSYACSYVNRGRVYSLQGDFDAAIAQYDEALNIDPKFALAYNNRGDARRHKGDLDRAIADFTEALRLDPNDVTPLANRGLAFHDKHDYTHALTDFSAVIRVAPSVIAYIDRGDIYRDMEQLDRAEADYGTAIKADPTDARGWRNRGLIRLFKGDSKGGLADYDQALRYDPADVSSWNNRGQAKMRTGDRQGAIADFRKALELRPGLKSAIESLKKLGAS